MKKIALITTLVLSIAATSNAQTKNKDLSLGLHLGNKEYNGEFGNEFFGGASSHAAGALSLSKYFSSSFDGILYLSYGRIDLSTPDLGSFSTDIVDLNLALKYKFANGKLLKEEAKLAPYIYAGLADAVTFNDMYANNYKIDFNFPAGIGFDFRLNDIVSLSLMSTYNLSLSDQYDNLRISEDLSWNDAWLFNSLGVKFNFPSHDPDKDGITSDADDCPEMAGELADNGCPSVKEEDKAVMMSAMKGLLFETGSAKIKPESIKVLDAVYSVLDSNKKYVLSIEGHTDNTGSDEINNKLSADRAMAAKDYLVNKGIDAARIVATGYGSSKPIASNDTDEGRKQNRRVMFNLMY